MTHERANFTYPNANRSGLSLVNITFKSAERIGMVGRSGAGKATLANIILGLLSPKMEHCVPTAELLTPTSLGLGSEQWVTCRKTSSVRMLVYGRTLLLVCLRRISTKLRSSAHRSASPICNKRTAKRLRDANTSFEANWPRAIYISMELSGITRFSLDGMTHQINFAFAKNDAAFCQRAWA